MIIYLGNHSSLEFGYLQGKYGNMGWLLSPKSLPKTKLRSFIPVAFDTYLNALGDLILLLYYHCGRAVS